MTNNISTYIPYVGKGPESPDIPNFLNNIELEFAARMSNDPLQKRKQVIVHEKLSEIARMRAHDMASRDYVGHVTPEGIGPNEFCRHNGYVLPDWYSTNSESNNIESISYGGFGIDSNELAEVFWDSLMSSWSHRTHLLGLNDFYAAQINIGVGYVYEENSAYINYLCVLSAP